MSNLMGVAAKNKYNVQCLRKGSLVWEETIYNRVVNEGLDDTLDKYFKGSAYTAAHFMGLKGVGTVVAGDTLASHTWPEVSDYAGDRPAITLGAVTAQAVTNMDNKCQFAINGDTTVAGIMVATVATGDVGVLYGAADFPVVRQVLDGDQLVVTVTFTQASA